MKLVATRLRNCWVIRPAGCVGTCGWINGVGWTAQFVTRLPPGIEVVD